MGSAAEVVDLSSDEGEEKKGEEEDLITNWIDELLDCDGEKEGLKDVILLDPYFDPFEIPEAKAKSGDEDSDDDCLILDGDPDKVTEVKDGDCGGGDDGDELLVVGEKGEIACRDFPHSRHTCASFPFSSTSHATHCSLCHCYVCDCPAPCTYWGNGESITHHCHATDKIDMWKVERKKFKTTGTLTTLSRTASLPTLYPSRSSTPLSSYPQSQQRAVLNPPRPCSKTFNRSHSWTSRTQPAQKEKDDSTELLRSIIHATRFKRTGLSASGVNQLLPASQPQYPQFLSNQLRPVSQNPRYTVPLYSRPIPAPNMLQLRPVSQNTTHPTAVPAPNMLQLRPVLQNTTHPTAVPAQNMLQPRPVSQNTARPTTVPVPNMFQLTPQPTTVSAHNMLHLKTPYSQTAVQQHAQPTPQGSRSVQDMLADIANQLGVDESITKSAAHGDALQAYTASSQISSSEPWVLGDSPVSGNFPNP